MRFDVITIFPKLFPPYFNESILKRAQKKGLLEFCVYNLRDWATDKHKTVDDRPYGGGPGMILRADTIIRCLKDIGAMSNSPALPAGRQFLISQRKKLQATSYPATAGPRLGGGKLIPRVIALDPAGKQLTQSTARRLAKYNHLILLCGRYEGFDERVYKFVDEKISIGPYVLAGGELPALVLIDAVSRMIHGVVGDPESVKDETHTLEGYVEYPQYTRPEAVRIQNLESRVKELKVPKVLLSGNHKKIAEWRQEHSRMRSA